MNTLTRDELFQYYMIQSSILNFIPSYNSEQRILEIINIQMINNHIVNCKYSNITNEELYEFYNQVRSPQINNMFLYMRVSNAIFESVNKRIIIYGTTQPT